MSGPLCINSETMPLIDRRLAILNESIRALKRKKNDLLPISKLPVELVTEIFLEYQSVMRARPTIYWEQDKSRKMVEWIGITHVCQRWRDIALNFSRLWIRIPAHYPSLANEMAIRSRNAHLLVLVEISDPRAVEPCPSSIFQHASRFQVLKIAESSPALVAKVFQAIKPTPAPYLLKLKLSSMEQEEPVTESSPIFDLLPIIDSRILDTRSLRRVQAPTTRRWDLNLFTGLTYLKLDDYGPALPRVQTSQREFLDALRRMPTLRFLDLNEGILPEVVDVSSPEPVHLPSLRHLTLHDRVDLIAFFLNHVHFPLTTYTSITIFPRTGHAFQLAHISSVVGLLTRLVEGRRNTSKLRHVGVYFSEVEENPENFVSLDIEAWASSKGPLWLAEGRRPDQYMPFLKADFSFYVIIKPAEEAPDDIDGLLAYVFGIFPPDDVVSLYLWMCHKYPYYCSFEPFFRMVSQLPALDTISLNPTLDDWFFEKLYKCDVQRDGVGPSYPVLRYLDFTGCGMHDPDLMTLYKCLKKRSARGLGPRRLRMELVGLRGDFEREMALLESVVDVVVWVT
ncbi:hypothetical protein M413DRAFT_32184 [Hebeloma cylindrosporum]|uniref:Uncharacterized protein n=1 Tax=Hebeloma cylindrosporum TaxID=76867 RepID=A0A0C2XD57_HEBCY|nr:hypothetical protein M413DRAFT_32184 [Hebeloma cylindrosporum h7]